MQKTWLPVLATITSQCSQSATLRQAINCPKPTKPTGSLTGNGDLQRPGASCNPHMAIHSDVAISF